MVIASETNEKNRFDNRMLRDVKSFLLDFDVGCWLMVRAVVSCLQMSTVALVVFSLVCCWLQNSQIMSKQLGECEEQS